VRTPQETLGEGRLNFQSLSKLRSVPRDVGVRCSTFEGRHGRLRKKCHVLYQGTTFSQAISERKMMGFSHCRGQSYKKCWFALTWQGCRAKEGV
jgi:hypothetical protein